MFSLPSKAIALRCSFIPLMEPLRSSLVLPKRRLFRSTTANTMAMATTAGPFASASDHKGSVSKSKAHQKMGTLRVVGPDRHGILAACTRVLNHHRCNIVKHEQWTDTRQNMFFQRVSFQYSNGEDGDTDIPSVDKGACEKNLEELFPSDDLKALWDWGDRRKKLGILVSKYDHCLWELLLRHESRELDADIEVVISNHETLRPVAETFGIPYHVTPVAVAKEKPSGSVAAVTAEASHETRGGGINGGKNGTNNPSPLLPHEARQLELLKDVDVVVLARYMQILSPEFLDRFPPDGIINIHHSFLPAFGGSRPYHRAHERGVKLIGATAHYTTEVLDDGPIIEQDVTVVSHRDSVRQLMKKGRVLERNVLLKAIEAHLDNRIIVHGDRCVVFGD